MFGKMLVQLICIMLAWASVSGELVDELGGTRGENRVIVCLGGHRGAKWCAGALWRPQWALARASCLRKVPASQAYVLRDKEGVVCRSSQDLKMLPADAARIRARFQCPAFESAAAGDGGDVVMLALDRPFPVQAAEQSNTSYQLLNELKPWMEAVHDADLFQEDKQVPYTYHRYPFFSTPLRMFTTMVVLPTVLFIALFVYVIFYTGPRDEVPYKSLGKEHQSDVNMFEDNIKYEQTMKIEDDFEPLQFYKSSTLEDLSKYEDSFEYNPYSNPWGI